jgi:hypothetical protein
MHVSKTLESHWAIGQTGAATARSSRREKLCMSLEERSKNSSAQPSPASPSHKRPASERRIQANRRNALRSTGPKTERGKRTVARNAIKHGFLAQEVVITAGDGKESLEAFHELVRQLCEYYDPVGVVEESLVQTIATCWWRKARVIRAENGEIRKRLDTVAVDRGLRDLDKANLDVALSEMELSLYSVENQADQQVSSRDRWSAMQVAQSDLRRHHTGLAYLSALLEAAKSEITSDGYISEKLRKQIFHKFSLWDHLFALTCLYAGPPEAKMMEGRPSEKVVDPQTDKKRASLVAFIDERLARISLFQEYASERESLAVDAEARSFSLPPEDATDKLLRYEAHVDRQLYRAMDQLERLQRQRQGENVPPPLNINLGRRK